MKPATENDYSARIVRTLVYIQQHLDDELRLPDLAGVAAFSEFHFHRIFRGLVGEPLQCYVRRLRLERAAQRLKHSGQPVTGIAFDAGFETHEAFTRAFKTMFGMTPSDYRASLEPAPEPGSATPAPEYRDIPPVEVKDCAPVQVVFLRHTGPYDQVGAAWSKLMAWAGSKGLLGPGMRTIGIVHDDPDVTPAAKIRYDACVAVRRAVEPEGEFGVLEIAGGKYATARHRGPYEELGKVYQRLYGGWLPASGYRLRDAPAFEEYLNAPMNTKPEALLTILHIPVE